MTPGNPSYSLVAGGGDSIYGKSIGGRNPNGWDIANNYFICEFDNFNPTDGKYDEITWLASLTVDQRNSKVTEFYNWIKDRYNYGFLQMPTKRVLHTKITVNIVFEGLNPIPVSLNIFKANRWSAESMNSFHLEDTIKQLWK